MASVAPEVGPDSTQTCRRRWPAEKTHSLRICWTGSRCAVLRISIVAPLHATRRLKTCLSSCFMWLKEGLTMTTKLSRPERTLFTTSCTDVMT